MQKSTSGLSETEGVFYFNNAEIKVGDTLLLEGAEWVMVGGGRSPDKYQTPFLWLKHEKFGTSLFAPALGYSAPHRATRPPEKEFVPRLEYTHVWKEKAREPSVLALRVAEAYEKAKNLVLVP